MSESVWRLKPRVTLGGRCRLSITRRRRRGTGINKRVRRARSINITKQQGVIPMQIPECEVAPIIETPKECFEIPAVKPKKNKRRRDKSRSEVDILLLEAGIEDPDSVCLCLKAGISNGCIDIERDEPLDQVILDTTCYRCSAALVVKLRDVLFQGPRGGSYWDGYENDVTCPNTECKGSFVVSEMCTVCPQLDTGKFYNHCALCPGFGECIGDSRQTHCPICGNHYYSGSYNQFKCCSSSDVDEDAMDLFGPFSLPPLTRQEPLSIFEYLYREQETVRFDEVISESDLSKSDAFRYLLQDAESFGEDTLVSENI